LRNVVDLDTTDKIVLQNDHLVNQKMVCLYIFPAELKKDILAVFPKAKISHQNSNLRSLAWPEEHKFVYASIKGDHTNLTAFDHEKILLSNNYQTENREELLYYLLLLYDQLRLDVLQTPTFLSGDIEKKDQTFGLLSDYIKNISILEIPNEKLDPTLIQAETQKYFDLYLSSQCAL
jgi:hypothetical protein